MNSMDEICVPVIKKILGHYLELNPNYNNGLQRNQQPTRKVHKRKNNPNATEKNYGEN